MRQWIRHRTARLNEASMRYTKSNGECWEPDDHTWEMRNLSKDFDESLEDGISKEMEKSNKASFDVYKTLINEKVVPELARTVLPLSSYTEFVWNMDLNNLRKMLALRLDGHAQKEIFQFAVAIYMLTEKVFPVTMKHFINEMYLTTRFNYDTLESIQRAIYAGETDAVAEKIDARRLEVVRNREALLKEIDYLSK
jgi:thymidylate synthase (FAD)